MITLQIRELCEMRGIKAPLALLMKAGISQLVAHNYLKGKKKNLMLEHIEILCTLLRCAPNDLFAWTPDHSAADFPENPLQAIRKHSLPQFQAVFSKLNLDEVRKRME